MNVPHPWSVAADYVAIRPFRTGTTYARSQYTDAGDSLVVVNAGTYNCRLPDGRILVARAGDLVYHAAGEPRDNWNDLAQPLECLHLMFRWRDRPAGLPTCLHDDLGRARLLASWLLEQRGATVEHAMRMRDYLLAGVLGEYLRLWRRPEDEMVTNCRLYIGQHLAEPLNVTRLARQMGLSRAYFSRRYKALTGIAPMADIQRLRLEEARRLLLTTELPIKAIAERIGFVDASHLGRRFKAHYGINALAARRATVTHLLPIHDVPDPANRER